MRGFSIIWPPPLYEPSTAPSPTLVSGVLEDSEDSMDDSMQDILGHGPFQWMALFCGSLALTVLVCHSFSPRLFARDVDHWCKPPSELAFLTPDAWKKSAIPVEPDGSFSRCTMYDPPLGHNGTDMVRTSPGGFKAQNSSNRSVVPCEDWAFDESLEGRSIVTQWRLVCDRRWRLTLSATAFTVAAMVVVPAAGVVADRAGRKPVITVAVVALIVAGLGCCTAASFAFFSIARLVVAGSASTVQVLTFILLFEITNSKYRILYAFIDVSLGAVLVPPLLLAIDEAQMSWSATLLLLMVPSSALICTFYMLTESPRWLLVAWDTRRAKEVILWAASTNRLPIDETLCCLEKLIHEMQHEDQMPVVKIKTVDFFRYALLRERSTSLVLSWFTSHFAFYAFRMTHRLSEQLWAEYLYVAASGIVNTVAYLCTVRFGRRKVLLTVLTILAWMCGLLSILYKPRALGTGRSIIALIAKSVADVAVVVNYVYTAELFPTVVRSIGFCSLYAGGRLGAVSGVALLKLTSADKVFLFLAVIAFVSAVLVQCLPETTLKIPDTMQQACTTEFKRKEVIQKSLALRAAAIAHPPRHQRRSENRHPPEQVCP